MQSWPLEKVTQSVVNQCAFEWYRLGLRLGYNDGQIQAMTHSIPTPEGKLQVIVEKRSMKDGKGKVVETLLDVCDEIMPLAVVAVMKDLRIKYSGTGKSCYLLVSCTVQCVLGVL